ncbi:MAG: outer membrane beta-barrel protein [Alphaproteobacteria bacterium]|nr:outer membrane beta-barrel protein [Alphaproteobacteria bacterium]
MKNFLLFSVAVIPMIYGSAWAQMNPPPVCGECPKAFQGFNVGANIGYGVGGATTKVKRFGTTIIKNALVTQGAQAGNRVDVRGVDGGLSIGYLHRFCNFVSGIDFTANWVGSSTSAKSVSTTTANGANIAGSVTARASYKIRLENSLQLAAKLGWVIDRTLPFIKLGWDNSQWKISGTAVLGNSSPIRISKDKRLNAFLWGAGVDFLMTRNFTLGLEYTGTIAGSKNIIKNDDASVSLKPQYNKFALTAKYIFG